MTAAIPSQVWILVDAPLDSKGCFSLSPELKTLTKALQEAIALPGLAASAIPVTVASVQQSPAIADPDQVIPLTLNVPSDLSFPERSLYDRCREIATLRQELKTQLGCRVGSGSYWLPVVLTAKGPLYAEVIGQNPLSSTAGSPYLQPVHLGDRWRQPLYPLAHQVLEYLNATPGVYLMQFGFDQGQVVFDRLFPFPAEMAIASLGVQTPNLLECHWRCLTHQPILDVAIASPVPYLVYDPDLALG
jgi:hypothetical protein